MTATAPTPSAAQSTVRPAVRPPDPVGFLPSSWSDQIYGYLPAPAGIAVTNLRPDPTSLAPWTGLGVFCLYTAILLALAAWRLRRQDT